MQNETESVTPEEKPDLQSKQTVDYRPGLEGEDCLACANFLEPDRCSKVKGEVSPSGTCDLWTMPDELGEGNMDSIENILFGPGGQ